MKILLFCPLNPAVGAHGGKAPQLFGRTNQSIFRQDYPTLDIMFSKGDNPYPVNEDPIGRQNILHNYSKARDFALDNDYDYLFTVEADMVLPHSALSKLLATGADVAYGLYCFRNTSTWSAWSELTMDHGRSLRKDPALCKEYWGKVIDVQGVGLGCTLISRKVLEAVPFRLDASNPDVHNDWVFSVDVREAGFTQRCDLSVVCGHISMTPIPRVIWPDPDEPRLYRNDYIQGIPLNSRGELELDIGSLGEFDITVGDMIMRGVRPDSFIGDPTQDENAVIIEEEVA